MKLAADLLSDWFDVNFLHGLLISSERKINSAKENEFYFRSYFEFRRLRNLHFPAQLDRQGIHTYGVSKNRTCSEKTAEVLCVQIPVHSEDRIEMNIFKEGATIFLSNSLFLYNGIQSWRGSML